jgi:hypothetical protein
MYTVVYFSYSIFINIAFKFKGCWPSKLYSVPAGFVDATSCLDVNSPVTYWITCILPANSWYASPG